MFETSERIAILGASRGLGLALAHRILQDSRATLWLSSRKIHLLTGSPLYETYSSRIELVSFDFSKPETHSVLMQKLKDFNPTRLFYCAGGGPFGKFQDKPWHSHLWAWNLNLLFPSQLLHSVLSEEKAALPQLSQIIFVGSAIAEEKADPGAASYASSKHGLKGLLSSLIAENSADFSIKGLDIRLYSPGYMDTRLLPPNSRPRLDGSLIADPQKIADDMLYWALTPPKPHQWHRVQDLA